VCALRACNIYPGGTSPLICGGGRVGLRRRFKAPISSEARVRIPSSAAATINPVSRPFGTRSSLFFRRALPSWGRLVSGGGSRRYSPRFLPFYALPCTLVNTFCFSTFALAWVVGLRRRQQALRILCKSAIIFVHPLGPLMMLLFIVLFQKQTPP